MGKELTDERRSEPRVAAVEPVSVRLRASGRGGDGRLLDINNRGAFIGTEMALEPGETVMLEIRIHGSDRRESIQSMVARQQDGSKSGLGVEFLPKSVEERDHIYYVVKTILALDLLGYERPKVKPTDTVRLDRSAYGIDGKRS